MIALGEKSEIEKNNTELRKNLENALVARLAADALAKSNLEEAKRKQLLLSQAQREIENQANKNKKSNEEILKAERQTALLNQQLSEVRKQLGELDELLSLSEERDQERKAQLKNVGSRLNQALASLASEERKRRKLEENEIGKITKINSKVYQAIIKGRSAKGWNRKQLAAQIAVKPQVIDEVETGKAKYDIKLIQKLERKLGIKLTGAEFK